MEAEYVALSTAGSELLWLKYLLFELGFEFKEPIKVYEDNLAVIARAEKIGGQSRAKHIDLRHHFIQDKVEAQEIQLIQVASGEIIADGFTKGLPSSPYRKFRDQLNLRQVQLGGVLKLKVKVKTEIVVLSTILHVF